MSFILKPTLQKFLWIYKLVFWIFLLFWVEDAEEYSHQGEDRQAAEDTSHHLGGLVGIIWTDICKEFATPSTTSHLIPPPCRMLCTHPQYSQEWGLSLNLKTFLKYKKKQLYENIFKRSRTFESFQGAELATAGQGEGVGLLAGVIAVGKLDLGIFIQLYIWK